MIEMFLSIINITSPARDGPKLLARGNIPQDSRSKCGRCECMKVSQGRKRPGSGHRVSQREHRGQMSLLPQGYSLRSVGLSFTLY
ncbi:MAG: hypothetical protein ACJAZ9_000628 [Neolewinella sp.]|jgi:hypothetical protein